MYTTANPVQCSDLGRSYCVKRSGDNPLLKIAMELERIAMRRLG